jgi:hypothetical protein
MIDVNLLIREKRIIGNGYCYYIQGGIFTGDIFSVSIQFKEIGNGMCTIVCLNLNVSNKDLSIERWTGRIDSFYSEDISFERLRL